MYELMKFDNDEGRVIRDNGESDTRVSEYPFEPVICAVERYRFQLFWERAVGILDDVELLRVKLDSERSWKVALPEPRTFRYQEWPPCSGLNRG
jgi:hypothetical protein